MKVFLILVCFVLTNLAWAGGSEGGGQEGNRGPRGNNMIEKTRDQGLKSTMLGYKGAEGN